MHVINIIHLQLFQTKLIFLNDNFPGDEFAYIICVHTGTRFCAGTSSKVSFQIYGTNAISRVSVKMLLIFYQWHSSKLLLIKTLS